MTAFGAISARYLIWPDLPPLPPRVDAIIEFGGPGDHDSLARALAIEGRAPFLVQSTVQAEAGTDRCLPAVPDVSVMCFHAEHGTTRGEAQAVGRLAATMNWNSVVLVTTPDQALRASLRTSRCFPGKVYVSTAELPLQEWPWQIAYQWMAFGKALVLETDC